IQLRSYTPFGTHAPMETWAAVVSVSEEGVKAWIGSQDLFYHQSKLADICGISKDNVEVYGTYIGGGFGGKVGIVAAFEAARLSMIVKRPVSVRWSREQLFQASYHRSPVKHQIEAGLDKEGNVCFWKHEIGSGPVIFNPQLISRPLQWATSFVSDSGGTRGAIIPYDFKNRELHFWDEKLPVPTGAWRGLGATSNAFATETAVDELARLLGKDTLKFRLENINENNPRYRAVLELAAKKGNWGEKTPPNMGRGIAAVSYKDKTFVAVVAIVSLEEQSVVVNKLICAHDCGLMLNPDIIRSQIEGNLIWGLGMALKENLRVEDGKFNADNFDGYPILRSHEIPEIEIHLIEDKTIAPSGAGEPSIAPTPAAICNAVSSITGRVINTLPIPEQIL
ncbi:MAG: xanthine dehydrogenase family protein molybdopterin-binding subunit, partial [Proteobacteria bacterium]|nr:xanthine dehydrogenase family protein molybdopterin-binding subunit [Pseudomonadota bacterium]